MKVPAILLLLVTLTTARITKLCRHQDAGTRLAFPESCTKFLICNERKMPLVRECPAGLHFNEKLQVCDFPSTAGCMSALNSILMKSKYLACNCDCATCCSDCGGGITSVPTAITTLAPEEPCTHEVATEPITQTSENQFTHEVPTESTTIVPEEPCTDEPPVHVSDGTTATTAGLLTEATDEPTSPVTEAPSTKETEGPTSPNTVEPSTSITESSTSVTTDVTVSPTLPATVAPPTKETEGPISPNTPAPPTDVTIGPHSPSTLAPSTDVTVAPTVRPSTDITIGPTSPPTVAPSTDITVGPFSPSTAAPCTDETIGPYSPSSLAPSTDVTVAPTVAPSTNVTIRPTSPPTVAPSTDVTVGPFSPSTAAPCTDVTIGPHSPSTLAPSTDEPVPTPTVAQPTGATSEPTNPANPNVTPTIPTPNSDSCDPECCGKPNAATFAKEGYCQKFIVCENQKAMVFECPNNLHFNSISKRCDYPQNAKCAWSYQPPSGPSAGPSGTHCAYGGRCVGQPDGSWFVDKSKSCSIDYVVCQCECEVQRSCGEPLMFNSKLGVCDWPTNFGC